MSLKTIEVFLPASFWGWNGAYGKKFYQYQFVVPIKSAEVINLVLIDENSHVAALGVLKTFGKLNPSDCCLSMKGLTLAIDIQNKGNKT